jgi:hypothetical protein
MQCWGSGFKMSFRIYGFRQTTRGQGGLRGKISILGASQTQKRNLV